MTSGAEAHRGATPKPPSGPNGASFGSVSCPRVGDCLAAGLASSFTRPHPILARLHAGHFRVLPIPGALAGTVPAGVSCQGTSATCELIAERFDAAAQTSHTLAVSMNAGTFGAPLSADVAGAGSQLPGGVSCPPAGACAITGSWSPDARGNALHPYAEQVTPAGVMLTLAS